ncbi:hypothetical protein PP175_28265 (plasmid) [Aneurinibacillus sp. Ricciae_BoGa-3]|uniref:hypothetical protein n=1 Tax=Aneurinibacillus sp. Ricciae_BoGa-3 TaxID=3022697 RepID=UPI0023410BFD|nr:hypothetical protein [Aneurinibacillus sp. Ricciae_BoGa-3]WCK57086.1 hypothetical protein PP175_28265 [Aneurinibacillus sp. Ricciae_BoGa-3]
MKNKPLLLTLAVTAMVSVAGCSTAKTTTAQPAFTAQEEATYMKTFGTEVLKPSAPSVIEKELQKNITRLNKQDASNAVDGLLYVIHQQTPNLNNKIQGLQTVLTQYDKQGVNLNDPKAVNTIQDATLKAFLSEVHANRFIISPTGNQYLARPDVKWVLDNYGKYMNDDLKAMAMFSLEENQKPFFNKDANSFDMNLVAQRIIEIEGNMKKFPKSFYQQAMQNSKNYYYQVYFGTNNSFLVDKNNKVLPQIIQNYHDTVAKYPDSQLAKDLKAYFTKLSATGNKVTPDVNVWLLDLTKTQTLDESSLNTANNKKIANQQLNNSIQQAIKANQK